jgi:hypothetical protein
MKAKLKMNIDNFYTTEINKETFKHLYEAARVATKNEKSWKLNDREFINKCMNYYGGSPVESLIDCIYNYID